MKEENSMGREFRSLVAPGKKLLALTFLQHLGMVTKKMMQSLEITSSKEVDQAELFR